MHQQRTNPFDGLENIQPQLSRSLLAHQQKRRVEEHAMLNINVF